MLIGQRFCVLEVDPAQIVELEPDTHIVDVREPEEFTGELGHLADAELVPLGQVISAAQQWDKKRPILFVCRSGRRSGQAATALVELGFEQVMNLRGGMIAVRAAPGARP